MGKFVNSSKMAVLSWSSVGGNSDDILLFCQVRPLDVQLGTHFEYTSNCLVSYGMLERPWLYVNGQYLFGKLGDDVDGVRLQSVGYPSGISPMTTIFSELRGNPLSLLPLSLHY